MNPLQICSICLKTTCVITVVISKLPDDLTAKICCTIPLEYDNQFFDHTSVTFALYRFIPPKITVLLECAWQLLNWGIIWHSTFRHSIPKFSFLRVNRISGQLCCCGLGHKIKVQSFPFPDVHLCFLWFSCARLFMSVELNLAYHHIDLTEWSKSHLAFVVCWNLYKYTGVPFVIAAGTQVVFFAFGSGCCCWFWALSLSLSLSLVCKIEVRVSLPGWFDL